MAMEDVKQIKETNGSDRTNAYLEQGWVPLATSQRQEGNDQWVVYSLGWKGDLPAKMPADMWL